MHESSFDYVVVPRLLLLLRVLYLLACCMMCFCVVKYFHRKMCHYHHPQTDHAKKSLHVNYRSTNPMRKPSNQFFFRALEMRILDDTQKLKFQGTHRFCMCCSLFVVASSKKHQEGIKLNTRGI